MISQKQLREQIKYLDFMYGDDWYNFPDDHPDIVALQSIIKGSNKNVKKPIQKK